MKTTHPALKKVSETSMLPLWARAIESLKPNALFHDDKAVELMKSMNYDFSKFKKSWTSQLGIAIRTELIDDIVRRYLEEYPDGCVINLGAGFDSRFQRLDNGLLHWVDLDLPEVMQMRKMFFRDTSRYRMLAGSILDIRWFDQIELNDAPPLILAEGVLMYFAERQVRDLLDAIVTQFPGAKLALEFLPLGAVGNMHLHDALGWMDTAFKWSLDQVSELEQWNSHVHLIKEWCILDYHWERWGWLAWLSVLPAYRWFFGEKIALLEVDRRDG